MILFLIIFLETTRALADIFKRRRVNVDILMFDFQLIRKFLLNNFVSQNSIGIDNLQIYLDQ